ncbi:hypothetical protein D030_0798B, partial [Vibrio parahaemolyticus AQ3810]
KLLDLLAQK